MRKLATAAAVSLALASGGAFGLGLGDIEMQSALNQPMSAEIALTSVQPGELDGMIVQLASADAFARAGIERSSVLLDLRFSVDESSGTPVIKVESTQPVVEPFLNFLLEVDWPQGRMVREYTVLLDPPVFLSPSASQRNTTADQATIVQSGEAALVVPTPIERGAAAVEDGLDVGLSDLEDAATEPVLTLDEATGTTSLDGEIVSLEDQLPDDTLLAAETVGSAATQGADAEGEIVSLTDSGAPNTDALAEREAEAIEALESFSIDGLEVELVGDAAEVADDVLVGADGQPLVTESADDGGVVVSLDDLIEPEENTGTASEITVGNGDTLFEIASDNVTDGASVQQMMMAILAANESAFINNNINLVRAGAILRMPDSEDVSALTQAEALAAISDQNQLWQDYRDSLRSSAATQVAQNTAPEVDTDTESAADVAADSEEQQTQEPIETAALDEATDGLSDEARAILDNARQEILEREELRIVADDLPGDTAASATADETTDSDSDARIGEVNRRLQLAREELSATRLSENDLSDQVSELQDTTTNLDAMVSLRQNEVARLESQLSDAREAAEARAEDVAEAAADSASDTVADAADAVTDAAGEATDTVSAAVGELTDSAADAGAEAGDEVQAGVDAAATEAENALAAADNAAEEVLDSGTNALTEAGETLGEVELLSPDNAEDVSVADAQTDEQSDAQSDTAVASTDTSNETRTWYQDFLDDPKRMAIAGIGGLGLLGVLGTLFFRRKRRDGDSDDAMLGSIDEAQFNDDSPDSPDIRKAGSGSRLDNTDAFAAAGAAGVAGVAGVSGAGMAAAGALDDRVGSASDQLDDTFADEHDNTVALGASATGQMHGIGQDDDIDKDDTISEVEVYLSYGLHGQAEELLTKAIEGQPENQEYASKLLQTYHAQGNGDAFHLASSNFHQRFGGDANPQWPAIAAMGAELRPGDALYTSSTSAVSAEIGSDGSGADLTGEENLLSSVGDVDAGSISPDFNQSAEAVDLNDDESAMMDESMDPAFAFDAGDLEATGDFSVETHEIAKDVDNESIDFPGIEPAVSAANEPLEKDLTVGIDSTMSLDDLDGLTESVDDLTLDLDQLSSDLELDSAELLNSDLSDLDIPDLTSDNELLLDATGSFGEGADEMDTMLDLAKAYIDMGDKDSASSALGEIVKSGSPKQVTEAETLLRNIS